MSTNVVKKQDVIKQAVTMDAKDKILGRLASEVAQILMGKKNPKYVPYMDLGDRVTIINAALIKVTGNKEAQKKYVRHSGFRGGYKEETLGHLRERKPEDIILHAVKGMLPKNKLGKEMIKKLTILKGGEVK